MLLPIAAIAFLAYLLLRPSLSRPRSKRLRLPTWSKAGVDKAMSVAIVAAALDWTAERQAEEVEATCRLLGTRHGVGGMKTMSSASEKEHAIS